MKASGNTNMIEEALRAASPIEDTVRMLREQQRERLELMRPQMDILRQTALLSTFDALKSTALAMKAIIGHQLQFKLALDDLDPLGAAIRDFRRSASEFLRFAQELPAHMRKNLAALAQAGWFLDPDMAPSDLWDFSELLGEAVEKDINADMAAYFSNANERIEDDLIARHPGRSALIREAFAAHRHGDLYSLSVQGFLIQAEGICFDSSDKQLFNKAGPTSWAQALGADTLERVYMDLLSSKLPLYDGNKQRKQTGANFNRHAIIHGESVDYNSEINSLKAMSFLNFVSHAFDLAREEQDGTAVPEPS